MNDRAPFAMTGFDYLLYAGIIWGWSTSWYAVTHQLGAVQPEVSVFWRFLITAPLMFALARWRGESCALSLKAHGALALTGMLMFSTNFILMYYAGQWVPSGLLAVIFALASVINLTLGVLLFGETFRWNLAIGGLLGALGVAALYAPQLGKGDTGGLAMTGLMLGVIATICFSIGNQINARLQRSGVAVFPAAAWGMVYGTLWAGILSLAHGSSFAVPLTGAYLGSMAFLIFSASILAFYTYLTLIGRIGPARASYATVIFPIFALMISTALEGYHWTPLAALGLVMAVAGNVLVLRRDRV